MYNFPETLEIRVGIHNGLCNVGNFGSAQRLDYTAIGRAVNVASRLEQAAPKNSILVSSAVRNLIKNKFETSSPIEVKAKGIDRPIIGHIMKNETTKKEIVTVQKNGISLKFDPNIVDTKEVDKFLSKIEK